jgi:hypothetical protein
MKKKTSNIIWIPIVTFLGSFVIGVLLTKLEIIKDISNGEKIIISVILTILSILFTLSYDFKIFLSTQKKEFKLWELKTKGDNELFTIRSHFHKLVEESKDENDLFLVHFMKLFKKLSNKIAEVSEKNELSIEADYFLNSDNVLNAFSGFEESYWYYTWQINNLNEELFDDKEAWCLFFEKTAKLVETKKMKEIKAILIFSDLSFIQDPKIQKVLAFFKTNPNNTCKIISKERYTKILKQNSFISTDDFGIYGSNLLYIEKYIGIEAAGLFIKNKHIIEDYKNIFNQLWNSDTMTQQNPSKETKKVEVTELICFCKS